MPTAPCTTTPRVITMPQSTRASRCRPALKRTSHSRLQTASSSVPSENFVPSTRRMVGPSAPGGSIAPTTTPTDRAISQRPSLGIPVREKSRPALAVNRLRLVGLYGSVGGSSILLLSSLLIIIDRLLVLLITGLLVVIGDRK